MHEKGFNLETYIINLVKAAHGIIRGLSKIVTIYCSNLEIRAQKLSPLTPTSFIHNFVISFPISHKWSEVRFSHDTDHGLYNLQSLHTDMQQTKVHPLTAWRSVPL